MKIKLSTLLKGLCFLDLDICPYLLMSISMHTERILQNCIYFQNALQTFSFELHK